VQIVSASRTGDKEYRLVSVCPPMARPPPITCTRQPRRAPFTGGFRIAYARKIEIEMRPAIFISILRESHLRFSKQQQQAAHEPGSSQRSSQEDRK
jgi:hypothetical protein